MPDFDTMMFMLVIVGIAAFYGISAAIFLLKAKKSNKS